MSYNSDILFLRAEFAKWWKLPSTEQEEYFSERVSIMVQDNEISEHDARKAVFERMIYQ